MLRIDLSCLKCNYNLRAKSASSNCPECGCAIRASLDPDRLVFADRAWLSKIASGSRIIALSAVIAMAAIPGLVFFGVAMVLLPATAGPYLAYALWGLVWTAILLSVFGALRFCARSSSDRRAVEPRTRRATRALALAWLATTLISEIAETVWFRDASSVLLRLLSLADVLLPFIMLAALMSYASTLLLQVPRTVLARRTRWFAGFLATLSVLAVWGDASNGANNLEAALALGMLVTLLIFWRLTRAHAKIFVELAAGRVSRAALFRDPASPPFPRTAHESGRDVDTDKRARRTSVLERILPELALFPSRERRDVAEQRMWNGSRFQNLLAIAFLLAFCLLPISLELSERGLIGSSKAVLFLLVWGGVLVLATVYAMIIRRAFRRQLRLDLLRSGVPICPCGYDLRGNPGCRCSECGHVLPLIHYKVTLQGDDSQGVYRVAVHVNWLSERGIEHVAYEAARDAGLSVHDVASARQEPGWSADWPIGTVSIDEKQYDDRTMR